MNMVTVCWTITKSASATLRLSLLDCSGAEESIPNRVCWRRGFSQRMSSSTAASESVTLYWCIRKGSKVFTKSRIKKNHSLSCVQASIHSYANVTTAYTHFLFLCFLWQRGQNSCSAGWSPLERDTTWQRCDMAGQLDWEHPGLH